MIYANTYIEYVLCIFEIVRNARTTISKQSFKGANAINRKSYNLPVAINRFQWVVLIPFDRVAPYNLFLSRIVCSIYLNTVKLILSMFD